MSFRAKAISAVCLGLVVVGSLAGYSAAQQHADDVDSRQHIERAYQQIGPRIEAHQHDLDAKAAGVWNSDLRKSM